MVKGFQLSNEEMEEGFRAHFDAGISGDIENYVDNDALLSSRYIFTRREGNRISGYCTWCHEDFEIFRPRIRYQKAKKTKRAAKAPPRYIHNNIENCPHCGSKCICKASGKGHSHLIDQAYFVYYEKSRIDPEAIVARGIEVTRDYQGTYRDVATHYHIMAYYIFKPGGSEMYKEAYLPKIGEVGDFCWRFIKTASVFPLFLDRWKSDNAPWQTGLFFKIIPVSVDWDSISKAVEGTPFRYSTWGSYIDVGMDMVTFFDLYSKYPCIEYLTKMGFDCLVLQKILRKRTYSAVNWRGKTPMKILKLSKQEIKAIKAADIVVTFRFLDLFHKYKNDLTITEIKEMEEAGDGYIEEMEKLLGYTSIRRAHNYLKRQAAKGSRFPSHSLRYTVITWKDYINDCITLEMDLSDKNVLFPRDLYQAHQNTIAQVKVNKDALLDRRIQKMLGELTEKYGFETDELIIRPAESTGELINEGKSLNHCVGTYAKNYVDGKTVILLVRKKSKPKTPYFTVEVRGKSVIQCRGKRNCSPDEAVREFMELYKQKLKGGAKKKAENRVRVMVPA